MSKQISSERKVAAPASLNVSRPATDVHSEAATGHKVEEQARTINSDELTRRGYVDTSNHLNGGIMQPRSHPVTKLEIADEQLNDDKGHNDSRCRLGSPKISKTL